jgi:hypothetical protein
MSPSDPRKFVLTTSRVWEITLRGAEPSNIALLDLSGFLYDFNLLFEVGRLATDPRYEGVSLNRRDLWYRRGRPLAPEDRLYVERLRSESPIELITILGAVGASFGAIWVLVQAVEKISNFRLNRAKLRLEVEKLQRESERETQPMRVVHEEHIELLLHRRQAYPKIDNLTKRLADSPVEVRELDVRLISRIRDTKRGSNQ